MLSKIGRNKKLYNIFHIVTNSILVKILKKNKRVYLLVIYTFLPFSFVFWANVVQYIITRPLLRFAAGESLSLQLCFQGIKITRAAGACKRSLYRKRFRPRGNLVCGRESQRAQTDFDFGLKPCAASPCLRGSRRSSADQRRLRADLESLKNQAMRVSAWYLLRQE